MFSAYKVNRDLLLSMVLFLSVLAETCFFIYLCAVQSFLMLVCLFGLRVSSVVTVLHISGCSQSSLP